MKSAKRRVGRPTAKPSVSKNTLSLRVTGSLKDRLVAASEKNDQSLSQEAEDRLEKSFFNEGERTLTLATLQNPQSAGLAALLFAIIWLVGQESNLRSTDAGSAVDISTWRKQDWLKDPYTYSMVEQALRAALFLGRPPGDASKLANGTDISTLENLDRQSFLKRFGAAFAHNFIQQIKTNDNTGQEDLIAGLRRDAGPLLDQFAPDGDVHKFIKRFVEASSKGF